jgi:hypothetical protein
MSEEGDDLCRHKPAVLLPVALVETWGALSFLGVRTLVAAHQLHDAVTHVAVLVGSPADGEFLVLDSELRRAG